jgi:hypothetical protein
MAEVCVCSDYFVVDDEGSLCLIPGVLGLRETLYFKTPGNYQFTKASYPWLTRIKVKVQAAGGGSGGADSNPDQSIPRPGASGGGYSESLIEAGALAAVTNIVVGEGGEGGIGNTDGENGGGSSFGGTVTAVGGFGGSANTLSGDTNVTANAIQGAGSGAGDFAIGGGASIGAIRISASQGLSGKGGDSQLGHGGYGRSTTGPGGTPRGYGAGAGGAFSFDGSAQPGGKGGNGIVIIELYG